ncbi:MAG: GHKL domain-containing protein [Methylococcales bacterium]|nr:GHKL domain-containing protein [Methylococcales bacterium]
MNTSLQTQSLKAEKLTDAFQAFNVLSKDLSNSYQELQKQVSFLNKELVSAHSERLKTLVEKEKLADRLQQILAALPAAVIVIDAEYQVIDCNAIAIDYLAEPLIGESWNDVVQRSLITVFDNPHERQLKNGQRVSIIFNELNNESGQIILLSDVTELRSLQDKLNQRKHLSAMGEMVASMAHQVRTPLATAVLYASQMNKKQVSDNTRIKFSNKILERLHYLERQVNDMLIFAKEGHLAMDVFSLQHFLQQVQENMAEITTVNSLQFKLSNQVQVDAMLGNEDALLGAVMNLLNNAVDALNGNGLINMIVTQKDPGSLQIKIQDNGLGIEDSIKQRLFEPFYTTKIKGTGLGLAVVDSVVRAHSGSIKCQSELHRGTVFTLLLPCINQYITTLSENGRQQMENSYEAI